MATETRVLGKLVPSSSADTYATHDELYGRGGYRSVTTIAERDAIPEERLKLGMEVRVTDENKKYYLALLSPATWEEVKTFNKTADLGIGDGDSVVTVSTFASQFLNQLASSEYANNFKDTFNKLYKDEVHLGKWYDNVTFLDLDGKELLLTNNNLYIDTTTQIIYTCSNSSLSEIGSVTTWNDVKGGNKVKISSGPSSKYVQDEQTIYFTNEGDIYFNGLSYTTFDSDSVVDKTTANSTNPVQTAAVYNAVNNLKNEFEGSLVNTLALSYSGGVLAATLNMKDGTSTTSTVGLSEDIDYDTPVLELTAESQQIIVSNLTDESNLVFTLNFLNNAVDRIPVNPDSINVTITYRTSSSEAKTLDISDFDLKVNSKNSINLADYISEVLDKGVAYYFEVSASCSYDGENYSASRKLTYTYSIVSLGLEVYSVGGQTDLLQAFASGTSTVNIGFNITGTETLSNISILTYLDGAENSTKVASSIGLGDIDVLNIADGSHTIQIVAKYTMGSTTIYSNLHYYKIFVGDITIPTALVYIPLNGGTSNPVITGTPTINVEQFCQYSLKYYVLYPESYTTNPNVVFNSKNGATNTVCGEYAITVNTVSTFTYRYLDSGNRQCNITCEDVIIFDYNVQVNATSLQLSNPTGSLKLYLDGSGKSNNSSYKDQWTYKTITTDFSGFTWGANDGWTTDSDGQPLLRLVNGANATVNYQPLSSTNYNNSGFTFTCKYKVSNIANNDEVILSFVDDNGCGLTLTPLVLSFASSNASSTSAIKVVLDSNTTHTIAVVAYPSTSTVTSLQQHLGVVYLYVDGIISGMSKINVSASTLVQTSPSNIKLSANECQFDVYSMRCYNIFESSDDILNMYLIDSGDYDLMYDRYTFNAVMSEGIPIPGVNNVPYLIINGTHKGSDGTASAAVPALSDKDNDKWGIQSIQFVDPTNQARNFYCVTQIPIGSDISYTTDNSPGLQIQGTSSAVYPVKNLKIKLKKGITFTGLPFAAMNQKNVSYNTTDATKSKLNYGDTTYSNSKKYQISENSTKETTFTIKVDYAESSGSHNAGTANLVNSLLTAAGDYIPPQEMQANSTTSHTADIRTTCEGKPCVLYYRMTEDNSLVYGGKANILNDKSDESVFGFTGIENYTQDFEDGSDDYLESDDFTPLRVITNPELAGTINTVYKESFEPRVTTESTDADGNPIIISELSGKTPFDSWNAFVSFLDGLDETTRNTYISLIISEATFSVSGAPYAFASDVDNKLYLITAKSVTTKPLKVNSDSSFATDVSEISGLAANPTDANILYAVSDEKGLYKIDLSTKATTLVKEIDKDCEAVAVNSVGNIVIAVEGDIDETTKISNENTQCLVTLTNELSDPTIITDEGFAVSETGETNGFEAITYYTDDIVFIGNQKKPKDIIVYDMLNSKILQTTTLTKVEGLFEEIADFDYNTDTNQLMILDSDLGVITVWNVVETTDTDSNKSWAFTRDESIEYKCPSEIELDDDTYGGPEGFVYDATNKLFYISNEKGQMLYTCSIGTPDVGYTLASGKENPNQCWEFRTNDNDMGFFLNTDFKLELEGAPLWFNNVWESRFPDDTDSNNAEYGGGRVPYLLYTIANWISSTNRYLYEDDGTGTIVNTLSDAQITSRANKFKTELSKYFNVNMLCDYYTITDVIAAADQRVKNMMWAFYRDLSISDPDNDEMKGMRAYPIFYDNDTILGVNNSGVLFDPLDGKLTLPWDCDYNTTCTSSGYGGRLINTNTKQFSFSGHDSVIWVNLRELMQDELKEAYIRMNDSGNTTRLCLEHLLDLYNTKFTEKYAEKIFNQDAIYKYVAPETPSHYAKAQGSRRAHRNWFLKNRISMFNAKYNIYDSRYAQVKGGSADANAAAQFKFTMDHDWWCTMKVGDSTSEDARHLKTAPKDVETVLDFKNYSGVTNGSSSQIYGLEHAKTLEINWDSTSELNFNFPQSEKDAGTASLPVMTTYRLSSYVVPASALPNLNLCPNLTTIEFNQINIPATYSVSDLIKVKTINFNNCIGSCNKITLAEGSLIENLHLSKADNTELKFVSLPLLSLDGITFDEGKLTKGEATGEIDETTNQPIYKYGVTTDSNDPWSYVTSVIVKDCPNINCEELLEKVGSSAKQLYMTNLNLEGDGTLLFTLMNNKVTGYQEDLKSPSTTCSLYGTYKLTTLLSDADYKTLCAYFPGLEIKNLEYSLFKFTTGTNTKSSIIVTNMETGKSGSDSDYSVTGHAKAILDKRHGYLVRPENGVGNSGRFIATALSDGDHNYFIDGNSSSEYLDGLSGDYMIYEPEYWYKGVNDFRNKAVYAAYASTKPSDPSYTEVSYSGFSAVSSASEFGETNAYLINSSVNSSNGTSTLTIKTSAEDSTEKDFSSFYYVLPENNKFKKFRVTGVPYNAQHGAVVIDKDKNILQLLNAPTTSGMYSGSYLIGDLTECEGTPYAIVFTVAASDATDTKDKFLVLTTSSSIMDLEDWVNHPQIFVGRSYSVPTDGDIISCVYSSSYSTLGNGTKVSSILSAIESRGKNTTTGVAYYTTFDYEQFKDIINLAYIKYGTTDLVSKVGIGATTTGGASKIGAAILSVESLGMNDTSAYSNGCSYYVDDSDEITYNPVLMGYEKLSGCGSSMSKNDQILDSSSTFALKNNRVNRTIPIYPQALGTYSIIYPQCGKYLDIIPNNVSSDTTTGVGYCGSQYVYYVANAINATKGYLSIGIVNTSVVSGSSITPHLVYLNARANTAEPTLSVPENTNTSGVTNGARVMIVPDNVEFINREDYLATL